MRDPIPLETAKQRNAEYYSTLAKGRDEYWRKMAAPRQRVSALLRLLDEHKPRRIVDLGCGGGQLLDAIRVRSDEAELCGIDLSAAQIQANRESWPGIGWHCADLEDGSSLPRELQARFDAVVASEIIEHVDRPEAFLASACSLAAPRGLLMLSTQSGRVGETERRVGHQRHYSKEEMIALLRRSGFEPLRVWNCGFPFHDLSKWLANLNPDASMERFGNRSYGMLENLACAGLRAAFLLNSGRRGAQLFAVARKLEGHR